MRPAETCPILYSSKLQQIMVYYCILWYIMVYYGILWYIMVYHGILWYMIVCYGMLCYVIQSALGLEKTHFLGLSLTKTPEPSAHVPRSDLELPDGRS